MDSVASADHYTILAGQNRSAPRDTFSPRDDHHFDLVSLYSVYYPLRVSMTFEGSFERDASKLALSQCSIFGLFFQIC